jgi:hypothetical protein
MSFHIMTISYLMAFRAGTDSAMSFIIPTYVLVSLCNIIYVERKALYYRRDQDMISCIIPVHGVDSVA